MNIIDYLRTFRAGPFAIFDFGASYLGFYLLSPLIIKLFALVGIHITKANIMWLVLPLSILVHILVGTDTPLTKMFLNTGDYFALKIVIIFMIYEGLKGVLF